MDSYACETPPSSMCAACLWLKLGGFENLVGPARVWLTPTALKSLVGHTEDT